MRKVYPQLYSIRGLLQNALHPILLYASEWINAAEEVENCLTLGAELLCLFEVACPKTGVRHFRRVAEVVSSNGKTAKELQEDRCSALEQLSRRHLITNTKLLNDIKCAIDEAFPQHVGSKNLRNDPQFINLRLVVKSLAEGTYIDSEAERW